MIQIATGVERPIYTFYYKTLDRSGKAALRPFTIYRSYITGLPEGLDGLLLFSDLQGVDPAPEKPGLIKSITDRLTGKTDRMPPSLTKLLITNLQFLETIQEVPPRKSTGVLNCGDLHVDKTLRKRGGIGDVTDRWLQFTDQYKWVAGVMGNHDLVDMEILSRRDNCFFLDKEIRDFDGLTIGGISGVTGNPDKPNRRPIDKFLDAFKSMAKQAPDILVMHEGPHHPQSGGLGQPALDPLLKTTSIPLIAFGHVAWEGMGHHPYTGGHLLNVDSKAVVLQAVDELPTREQA